MHGGIHVPRLPVSCVREGEGTMNAEQSAAYWLFWNGLKPVVKTRIERDDPEFADLCKAQPDPRLSDDTATPRASKP